MQSRSNSTNRQRLALVAFTSLWLGACGGGGGGSDPATGAAAAAPSGSSTASAPAPSPSSPGAPATASGPAPVAGTGAPAVAAPSPTTPAPTAPSSPAITVQGTDAADTLQASVHPAVMAGGKGDDIYLVTDPADVVIEQAGEGVDEVRTSVGYTLPNNVENMSVTTAELLAGGIALTGNSLNNRIAGPPFGQVEIYGLDGDDILEGGIRSGAYLDGGPGNDTLINNTGKSRGGPGADLFVVSARGAMTAPDVPLTILDFTPAEGDRIDGSFLGGGDPAALFASGNLQFDAANQRLVYTLDPARFAVQPFAVQQIILLPGVTSFDPAWIIRR